MKCRSMILLSLALAKLAFVGSVWAQATVERTSPLTVAVEVSSQTLYPHEPLQLVIHVKNDTANVITAKESWECFVRYKRAGNGQWKLFHPDRMPMASPVAPSPLTFAPGEEITLTCFLDTDLGGHNVFAEPGQVEIEVSVGRLKSEPVTVTVVQPTGEDKAALDDLEASSMAKYLDMFPARYDYSDDKIGKLSALAEKHSISRYGTHAAYATSLLHIEKGSPDDLQKAREILENLHKKQPSSRALYYLGEIARKQGDKEAMTSYKRAAAAMNDNPYFREQAIQASGGRLRPHLQKSRQ